MIHAFLYIIVVFSNIITELEFISKVEIVHGILSNNLSETSKFMIADLNIHDKDILLNLPTTSNDLSLIDLYNFITSDLFKYYIVLKKVRVRINSCKELKNIRYKSFLRLNVPVEELPKLLKLDSSSEYSNYSISDAIDELDKYIYRISEYFKYFNAYVSLQKRLIYRPKSSQEISDTEIYQDKKRNKKKHCVVM